MCAYTRAHWAHAHNETKNLNTNRYFYNTHTARETKTERETFAASKFGCFEFSPKRHDGSVFVSQLILYTTFIKLKIKMM